MPTSMAFDHPNLWIRANQLFKGEHPLSRIYILPPMTCDSEDDEDDDDDGRRKEPKT
jgi:hypothetical protein